jgi:serine/threonine protein kinase
MKTPLSDPRDCALATEPTRLLPCATPPGGIGATSLPAALKDTVRPKSFLGLLRLLLPDTVDLREGSTFGSYRLLMSLGNGGFGEVWLAEQQEPLRRKVALKFIRPAIITREAVSRFERERQAMAMMEHENIAKVYDANCIDGTLYFAMEYVPGLPITKFIKAKNLDLRQRIELFIRVCRAVHHAHQKQVLHRDLKPANILVTERDGVAVPKLIDFGVAKPLTEGHSMAKADSGDMATTLSGHSVGTPQYMSPEQALGLADIDATSDTYALGILLYEMLVGEPPITKRDMDGLAPHQQLDCVIKHETELPSTVWRSATGASTKRRYDRTLGDNPKRISRQMRGDLDWIVRKALEKDRSRRYSSADKLADDLAAYLRDEPVSAGPPSLGYRVRKSCRRHRTITLAASIILFVMFCAGSIALAQWQRAEAACVRESQAREAEARARAASNRANTETLHLIDSMLHNLGSKLEGVNQTSLLQSDTDQAVPCFQAHCHDFVAAPE